MQGIKKIFVWSKRYIPLFILIIALCTLLQFMWSYIPLFVQYAIAILANEEPKVALPAFLINWFKTGDSVLNIILMVSFSMVMLQVIRCIMRFISNYFQGALAQYVGYDLRCKMYTHICELDFSYHNKCDVGDLIQRTTSDIDQVSNFISQHIPNFLNIFVTVVVGAYQVALISPSLMFVSLAIIPVTGASSIIYFRYCNKKFDEIEKAESNMTTIIQENVNSARVVRAFANEKYEFEHMDEANKKYTNMNIKFNRSVALFWSLSDILVFVQYAITVFIGILLAKNNVLGSSDIIAAVLLLDMLVWPMRGLGRTIAFFGKASVAAKRIDEILKLPSEYEINGKEKPVIKGEIEFKDVCFKFDDDDKHLLDNISFKINKGETIALVGKTGSGKSTICNLLVRFLESSSGEILLDNHNIKDIDKKYLRENVKYVLQNPFLYSKSIYENIAISGKDVSEKSVYKAAEIASIHDDIIKFKEGYSTIVGEKGTTLSGGQKQRLAIARMLVSDSPIIIFDDSLSALDTKTDKLIRTALKSKDNNQTMIIVTHRITTAKDCDRIFVLEKGKVSQMGTHDELLKVDGLYKELYGISLKLEEEFNKVVRGDE